MNSKPENASRNSQILDIWSTDETMSASMIARKFKVTKNVVIGVIDLARRNGDARAVRRKNLPIDPNPLVALFLQGKNVQEIAAETGVNPSSIRRLLFQHSPAYRASRGRPDPRVMVMNNMPRASYDRLLPRVACLESSL